MYISVIFLFGSFLLIHFFWHYSPSVHSLYFPLNFKHIVIVLKPLPTNANLCLLFEPISTHLTFLLVLGHIFLFLLMSSNFSLYTGHCVCEDIENLDLTSSKRMLSLILAERQFSSKISLIQSWFLFRPSW